MALSLTVAPLYLLACETRAPVLEKSSNRSSVNAASCAIVQVSNRDRHVSGSGFLISKTAVVSAGHVLDGTGSVDVQFGSGLASRSTDLFRDEEADIGVVRIAETACEPLTLCGANADADAIASSVLVSGFWGASRAVTSGIVSSYVGAPSTSDVGVPRIGVAHFGFVSLDVSTYPGMSGGPVFAASGCVSGMAVASGALTFRPSYAITSRTLSVVVPSLLQSGELKRHFLGVEARAVAHGAQTSQVEITRVLQGSPASRALIEPGSIVLRVDQHDVRSVAEFRGSVSMNTDAHTELDLSKDDKLRTVIVNLAPREQPSGDASF